ncbi:3210_t:CDS:2 [Ambispora leptoticha]|uniref:GPI mannosyltransferase 2 n=1 Tax=Ambispora leptoticha TaxID=144679 RepID=A0A9N9AUK1_9GLOM|nr:3210_t:CDS:2 [Ambispora leptoticha]
MPISQIVSLGIASRLFIWSLATISSYLSDDYDSSASTLLTAKDSNNSISNQALQVSLRWDAFYFLHLAEEGYVYEQEHAFFPLFPILVRGIANFIKLFPLISTIIVNYERTALLVIGVSLSNFFFVAAAVAIYNLSIAVFHDKKFALITAIFYILSPSCIFMSSLYTESLFAFLSFLGMQYVVEKHYWRAAFVWAFASFTRSNGIVYVGFFVFDLILKKDDIISNLNGSINIAKVFSARILKSSILCVISTIGFVVFEIYGYMSYCLENKATTTMMTNPHRRPWCKSRIPLLYTFVQTYYWNCGFLSYYQVKQIPNFLFATPMILLSFFGIFVYAEYDWKRFISLGWRRNEASNKTDIHNKGTKEQETSTYFSSMLLPFIYLWMVLLVYALTSMHIQVITRFFSSQPTVYWFASYMLIESKRNDVSRKWAKLILNYFVIYGLCGVILFANFFPPA